MRYSFGNALCDFAKAVAGGAVFGTVLIAGYAQAAVLTPEGAAVFAELWEWFKAFAATCMLLGGIWLAFALVCDWLRPATDPLNEYEGDAP